MMRLSTTIWLPFCLIISSISSSFLDGVLVEGVDEVLLSHAALRGLLVDAEGIIMSRLEVPSCFPLDEDGIQLVEPIPPLVLIDQITSWTVIDEEPTTRRQGTIATNQVFMDNAGKWISLRVSAMSGNITIAEIDVVDPIDHELVSAHLVWCHRSRRREDGRVADGGSSFANLGEDLIFELLPDYPSLKRALVIGRPVVISMDLKKCGSPTFGLTKDDSRQITSGFFVDDWEVETMRSERSLESLVLRPSPTIHADDDGKFVISTTEIVVEEDGCVFSSEETRPSEAMRRDAETTSRSSITCCCLGKSVSDSGFIAKSPRENKSSRRHIVVNSVNYDFFGVGIVGDESLTVTSFVIGEENATTVAN